VLFADVCDFSSFTQVTDPIEVVKSINGIHSCVYNAIIEEGGVLNKFMGDGLLAMFGAPMSLENHGERAVRAAVRAQSKLNALNGLREKEGLMPLPVRIGINTGEVVSGCVGTIERTEYTVMGHVVNCAARIESMAEPGEILIGEATQKQLGKKFVTEHCGERQAHGIEGELSIYKVRQKAKSMK